MNKSTSAIPLVNPSSISKPQKFRRSYRACLNCRARKVKCDLGSVDNPREGRCARCQRERKDCIFVDSKRGGYVNTLGGKKNTVFEGISEGVKNSRRHSVSSSSRLSQVSEASRTKVPHSQSREILSVPSILNEDDSITKETDKDGAREESIDNSMGQISTSEDALVFLARAAGSIAKADARDNIDARKKHEEFDKSNSMSTSNSQFSSKNDIMSSAFVKTGYNSNYSRPYPNTNRILTVPFAESTFELHPKGSNNLAGFDFISGPNSILTVEQAESLINKFFNNMNPYFPFLPNFMHSSDVLAEYPILLCAILTISSRYHSLDNDDTSDANDRNLEVHERLWVFVQRLMSQSVWAEASTRSIGTIYAFLLFTEWNPRAIHWRWSDFANKIDENKSSTFDEQNLTGLGAMRRSYKMTWMLSGNAVRLAQEMGFMEVSSKTFLATHIAEINSAINVRRRSMLAQSLSEVNFEDEQNDAQDLEDGEDRDYNFVKLDEDDLKNLSEKHEIKFTVSQKASLELLQITSLAHESLYGHKAHLGNLNQKKNLSVLGIFTPLINNWKRKYKRFLIPSDSQLIRYVPSDKRIANPKSKESKLIARAIEREEFIFEFHYVQLYIYSLALKPTTSPSESSSKRSYLKFDEMAKSAKYIEQAFISANEMLLCSQRLHRLKMLRFMPVRWLSKIVKAIAFIVKCYMTITASKKEFDLNTDNIDATVLSLSMISPEDIIQTIRGAAITLRDSSPDELHLCLRYSNILMYLSSEMSFMSRREDESNNDDSAIETNGISNSSAGIPTYSNSDNLVNSTSQSVDSLDFNQSDSGFFGTVDGNDMGVENDVMGFFLHNQDIGLEFVGPWTEMIEHQLNFNEQSTSE